MKNEKHKLINLIKQLANEAAMQTQELAAPLFHKSNKLFIGIPKEITYQELRAESSVSPQLRLHS